MNRSSGDRLWPKCKLGSKILAGRRKGKSVSAVRTDSKCFRTLKAAGEREEPEGSSHRTSRAHCGEFGFYYKT